MKRRPRRLIAVIAIQQAVLHKVLISVVLSLWPRPSKQTRAPLYPLELRRQRRAIIIKYGIFYVCVIAVFVALFAIPPILRSHLTIKCSLCDNLPGFVNLPLDQPATPAATSHCEAPIPRTAVFQGHYACATIPSDPTCLQFYTYLIHPKTVFSVQSAYETRNPHIQRNPYILLVLTPSPKKIKERTPVFSSSAPNSSPVPSG
ncbi:hypothetical protein NMY22_g13025 [Coprinellus aureogranulatus]|nr:hypothetical protein NMY22_g13025 [Coprinellus aureogranulatus]